MQAPVYRRAQFYRALWWIVPLSTAAGLLPIVLAQPHGRGTPLLALAVVVVSGVSTLLMLGRLVVQLDERELAWRYGFLGWPRWRVALEDIAAVEKHRLSGIGSGIRATRDGRSYTAGGGHAVRLTLRDGRRIVLGSDDHERLAAMIEIRLHSPR